MASSSILFIDHNRDNYQLIQNHLAGIKQRSFTLTWAPTIEAAWQQLASQSFDLALVADTVGGRSGIAFIRQAVQQGYQAPFILIAEQDSYDTDLEAMQAGAKDYLNKAELTPALLERSIRYAVEAYHSTRALKESEERFVMAARAVNGVVYDWDLATNHIFRSDGLKQVIGVRPSEITQEHGWWERRIHPEDIPLLEKTIDEKINGGADSYALEYRVQHIAGHWIDVWEQAYILRDSEGNAYRVVGTRTDITERKRTERNTRFLANLGEQMLSLNDPEDLFAYACDAIMQHFELDRISFDLVDQAAETVTILAERHRNPPPVFGTYAFSSFHRELQKRMVKGQAMVVEDTSVEPATAPLYDTVLAKYAFRSFVAIPRLTEAGWVATMSVASGSVRHWREDEVFLLKQTSDLVWLAVENARLLKQLREAQDRFEIALKNSQITVYTCDLERRYTWVANSEVESPGNSIVGKRDEEVLPPGDLKEIIDLKKAVLDSGIGTRKECIVTFRGQLRNIDIVIEPLRNAAGVMEGLIVAAADITSKREIERQVQQATNQIEVQRRIEQLREEERQQIARDLHDGPIQNLIGLTFSINTIQSITQDPQVHELLASVSEETQNLVSELRGLCNELRPPVLVQFGLSSAIRAHASDFQQRHPEITVHLNITEAGRLLPEDVRLALYRIFQEALNNIVRHSSASEISVGLSMVNGALQLEVADNGRGFQNTGELVYLARGGHFGLVGMHERAEAIGGKMRVISAPGKGTQIIVSVPIVEPEKQKAVPLP